MAMKWRSVALMASLMIVFALVLLKERDTPIQQGNPVQAILYPVLTGFGLNEHLAINPALHCTTIPGGIRLSEQPISKELLDQHFSNNPDWSVISARMQSGDVIYAYDNRPHPPPGITLFIGLGGGYLVLRDWCVVGRIGTWVE